MDGWFVLMLVALGLVGLINLGSFLASETGTYKKDGKTLTYNPRRATRKAALIPVALAGFFLLMSMWVIVGTNQVGIFTSFAAPYAATDNGFELKRPWAKKTEFDGSRQFLRFCGNGNNDEDLDKRQYPGVNTKIDGNAKATLCGTIAWQMKATTDEEKQQAIELFRQYKTFERVSTNLVYPGLKVAIGKALANLNPLIAEKNMSVADINEDVLGALKTQVSGSLQVLTADIAPPDYDDDTDKAIAADLAQKAKTSLAGEKEKTNIAEAKANGAIDDSIQDPKVLVNKCLDIAKELGYNPGLCMMSSGAGIILPGDAVAKKQ